MRFPTWRGGAFVANFSSRILIASPALEELYNQGPHGGNATFEIGDPNLKREQSDAIDVSLRHSTTRVRAEWNYFYYHIRDFIFLAPNGAVDEESGLVIANYTQGTSRYTGTEGKLDLLCTKTSGLGLSSTMSTRN
jgi:iron complex outermembrane receptor protein